MARLSFEQLEMGPVIGVGTVGTVYRATMKPSGEVVAVKVLKDEISSDQLVRQRFRREMQILERLQHPHIIRYFGGGEQDGKLFFAMECLDGGNVRDLLERFGHLSWQEAASLGRQVSSALQLAHNNGIIHRDLKPGNLFLDSDANIKLGDFGIARDTTSADITSTGLTVGTHAYMAPEQIKGETSINGKADLYSLGCVLFEVLTGRKPFDGTNFAILFEQHLHKSPPVVADYVAGCPAKLSDAVSQLLAKDPDERPFNARVVQGVMQELLASEGTRAEGQSFASAESSSDVGAASVVDQPLVDPGKTSLQGKLQPEVRPEPSWKLLAIVAMIIVVIVAVVVMSHSTGVS